MNHFFGEEQKADQYSQNKSCRHDKETFGLNFKRQRIKMNRNRIAVVDHEDYQANQNQRKDDSFDEAKN